MCIEIIQTSIHVTRVASLQNYNWFNGYFFIWWLDCETRACRWRLTYALEIAADVLVVTNRLVQKFICTCLFVLDFILHRNSHLNIVVWSWYLCWLTFTHVLFAWTELLLFLLSSSIFHFFADSAWLKGAQVLMTLSLILLLFMEFILIGYTCVERLKSYKPRMVGIVMGMSIAEGQLFISSYNDIQLQIHVVSRGFRRPL